MCGIAGFFDLRRRPASAVVLKRMGDAIAHRGPDGEGVYTDGGLGFVHRRLAIIDLSPAGHQPMSTRDGRYIITYNGEVYNFQELRMELETLGYAFHSKTDTEVVLYAYAHWGAKCLDRFNGMFAFAIWDKLESKLFIARDRYGIKPVYYAWVGSSKETLVFGSEVKAILQHPSYAVEMDREALLEYFTFQNTFTQKTLFKGVNLLPAGTYLEVSAEKGRDTAPTRYWDFDFSRAEKVRDEREYIDELDRLLRQAVSRQLISDVEVGSYLSGGMDSGSVTALSAAQLPYIKTFTCGFDLTSASGLEYSFDERAKAEHMSYLFKTEHYEMVLKSGDMERVLPKVVWHIEEPRVGQSYPNYYVAQLASKFVKVVMSGAGGDELFAGYPWRYYRAVVNDNFEHYVDQYYLFWQRLIPNKQIQAIFKPIWGDVKDVWTRDIFRDVFARKDISLNTPEDYVNHSLYFEAKTFLNGLLVIEDKLSMAHGLESRVPFLDNDLVDFAMKLPVGLKLANLGKAVRLNENEPGKKTTKFFESRKDGKKILRKTMERYIPKEVTTRAKQGFSAPDASWFKGDSIDWVKRVLDDDRARIYEYLDPAVVRTLVSDHLEGRENRRLLIWSLLNVEQFCKAFLPK